MDVAPPRTVAPLTMGERHLPMTDREFIQELRRGLLTIMRAVMRRYGLGWADFLPREQAAAVDFGAAGE